MLTRLEADGFKNLVRFEAEFGPFTCLAGPNGVGKSNILDAIQFLSLLADRPLLEAALSVRGAEPETADPLDLFWTDGHKRATEIRMVAEMVVEREVLDDFGREAEASSTFLRYEIKIGHEAPARKGEMGKLILRHESLDYIPKEKARHQLGFPLSAQNFRDKVVMNKRRGSGYISTHPAPDKQIEIQVHQDGGRRGPPAKASATSAPATIVATSNTSATPTILAARREMQNWRLLALEPSSMRQADRFRSERSVSTTGAHLPATLHRLAGDEEDETRLYSRVASRLAELVPVRNVRVEVDEVRRLLTLKVQEGSGIWLPARSLSDGTLRFLALSILQEDPEFRGLVCLEEPENGIHPEKIPAMLDLLRDLAVDSEVAVGGDNPLRQVVVATHSPHFVQHLYNRQKGDLLFATEAKTLGPSGRPASILRCHPLEKTWRAERGGKPVGLARVLAYLTTPRGAQTQLFDVA